MPFLGLIVVAIQVFFAMHAIKTGRNSWLFIILFFPFVGSMIYLFSEYLPEMKRGRTIGGTADTIANTLVPTRRLKHLQDTLAFSDTVANRQQLAHEYVKLGAYEEAIPLYKSCLEGVYENEPDIKMDIARAHFKRGAYDDALDWLIRIEEENPDFEKQEHMKLIAESYRKLDEHAEAREAYEDLVRFHPNEENTCQYGIFLREIGDMEKAKETFNEVLVGYKHAPSFVKRKNKKWYGLAKQNLFEMEQGQ